MNDVDGCESEQDIGRQFPKQNDFTDLTSVKRCKKSFIEIRNMQSVNNGDKIIKGKLTLYQLVELLSFSSNDCWFV